MWVIISFKWGLCGPERLSNYKRTQQLEKILRPWVFGSKCVLLAILSYLLSIKHFWWVCISLFFKYMIVVIYKIVNESMRVSLLHPLKTCPRVTEIYFSSYSFFFLQYSSYDDGIISVFQYYILLDLLLVKCLIDLFC